ncbi:MAG: S1C family serine protease [Solirubrobacterales bacterium]
MTRHHPTARRRVAALLAAAALLAGFSACGEDEDEGGVDSPVAAEESEGDARRVVIEAEEGAFNPHAIFEAAAPGVVTVRAVLGNQSSSLFGGPGGGQGQGSGFVISEEGEIVTNAHVVTDAEQAGGGGSINEAREVYVQFADLNQVEAEIVGVDPFADVALLRVDPEGLDLKPLPLGSEDDVRVGDGVAAIGSPFGQEQSQSLSIGIVSAKDRSIQSLTEFQIDGAIQTDAAINPGNSGGPLLDAEAEVVGINQQIRTASGGNEGVGFAVPIDLVERSIEQLRDDGDASYSYIGVRTTALYPQLAERLGLESDTGALVAEVVEDGPADEAGLRGSDSEIRFQGQDREVGGDVITAVNGDELVANSDLPRLIALLDPGDDVTLDLVRDGEEERVELTLGERPDQVE